MDTSNLAEPEALMKDADVHGVYLGASIDVIKGVK